MAIRNPEWTGAYVEHPRVTANTEGPSRTRQEFAEECDINTIMERYEATGIISHVDQRQPMYLDMSDVPDLASAIAVLENAREAFMTLPAKVRREFDNSTVAFVEFAENPENLKQMQEWGLAPLPEPPQAPMRVEVVNPPGPLSPSPASPAANPGPTLSPS